MVQATGIEWTDATSNPLKYRDRATGRTVWACVKHSPGCAHCYAETLAKRYGRGGPFTRAEMAKVEPYLDGKELDRLARSRSLDGKKVFLCDMTDLFGDWVPFDLIDRVFAVMALRRNTTFQVLTKRAARMREYFASRTWNDVILNVLRDFDAGAYRDAPPKWSNLFRCVYRVTEAESVRGNELKGRLPLAWPLPNVWLGVSVEDQQRADERIPELLKVPAAARFLSCEPLLGPVELVERFKDGGYRNYLTGQFHDLYCKGVNGHPDFLAKTDEPTLPRIHWVIVGGESGPRARPFELDWARLIQDQCDAAGVPWFMKQAGSNPHDWDRGDPANQEPPAIVPLRLRDRKGGDLGELPASLRVREFPAAPPGDA